MLLFQMWDPTPVESIMFAAIRKFLLAVFSYATLLGISDTRAWVRVGFHLVASESLKTRIEWTHKLFLLQALQSLGIPRAMEMNVAPHTLGHPWFYMGYRSSFTTSGDREGPANDFCFGAHQLWNKNVAVCLQPCHKWNGFKGIWRSISSRASSCLLQLGWRKEPLQNVVHIGPHHL